ncbi:transposase [Streptomyces mirabilis]|uniref:transposase n=1 Tax=Streptomyces mirabilis TaxID=68239 RepID=UPI0036E6F713
MNSGSRPPRCCRRSLLVHKVVGPLRVCAGRTRGPGRGGLDLGDRRRGVRSRQKRGSLTGPNPVDRGKKGSKLHVLSDAQRIPLAVAVSGANRHDSLALKPLIRGIPAVRSRPAPAWTDQRPTTCLLGVLLRRTPGLAARARARRAHRAARHRVRRTPRSAPLEDRTVDRLALRLPPPHRPIRTKGLALPRLPRPGPPELLQEARETCHVRQPLSCCRGS